MAERFGVEGRGKFYEEGGAIRDVVQNHMLQVVAFLAMEPPTLLYVDSVREVERRGATVTLNTTDADATTQALLVSGVAWRDLEVQSANLDDIFVTLVDQQAEGGK